MSGLFSRLLRPLVPLIDAFVTVIEPMAIALAPGTRWIAVETPDDDLAFYRVSRRTTVFVAKGGDLPERTRRLFLSGNADVELRLSPDRVIAAQLKVPAEAAGFAAQIVDSRLDRLTPWNPDRLLFGFSVAPKAGPDGQVTVDVAATSRDIVARSLERLAPFGITPSRVGSAERPITDPLRVDMFKGQNDIAQKKRRRHIAAATFIVFLLSLGAFFATSITVAISSRKLADADAALADIRGKLVGAVGNGDERQRDLASLEAKRPETANFKLIDRIATILPDTTYLDELEITAGTVRLAGRSTEAPALVSLLEAEPNLSQASFAAPVTRQADGSDRFDITVDRDGAAIPEGAAVP